MKKLVIKTAIITLVAIIGLASLFLGITALFFPKTMAKICDTVGADNCALKNYVRVYDKSGDLEDLFVVVSKCPSSDDHELRYEYLKKFVDNKKFEEFITEKEGGTTFTTKEFVLGLYMESYYETKGIYDSIYLAQDLVIKYGYTEYGPFSVLISFENLEEEHKELIKSGINAIYVRLDTLGKAYADRDIALL